MFKLLTKALSGKLKSLLFEEMANDEGISWYHGNLSREDTEEIFKNASLSMGQAATHGLFLVRDSRTTPGDFVLSVMNKGELLHFQIRRHGEDAFFSINGETPFHGLETLIDHCQKDGQGLPCVLGNAIKKDPPPPDTRSHGRSNLLHRATKEGNFTVASELLKCGYRNIEAKNQDGQTAVHLACIQNIPSILQKLIESEANVNCRDQQGNTPLHYACQNNCVVIVKILLNGGANVQLRNTNTGWVPLHEAAYEGHKEIVEYLLRMGAPSRPRTKEGKTPQQLAEENGHYQVSHLIKTHEGPKPSTTKDDWYHGTLSRAEAIQLLTSYSGNSDGRFLVRYSEREESIVLTMMSATSTTPYNYFIRKQGNFYFIDDGPLLDTLEHVIEHYSTMSDGLPTILQVPIKPKPKPPLPDYHPSSIFSTMPAKNRKGYRWSEGNNATLPLPPKTKPRQSVDSAFSNPRFASSDTISFQIFIPRESLIMKEVIGEGEFGSVYKAIYQTRSGTEAEVAVKTMHSSHMLSNRDAFLEEAEVMMKLNHHCIVKLIGISEDSKGSLMIQELVPLGSMLTFILRSSDQVSVDYELPVWASQIACGMQYLEINKIVHRDLAARNILLATRHQAKISDFGLSRNINDNKQYYMATKGGRWPVKWYAPESYNYGKFSSASDVWSFGVTLWEMYSYGQQPFGEMRGAEVIEEINDGNRLEKPDDCPVLVYQMMERCWEYDQNRRPSFSELYDFFASRTNYENVRDLVPKTDIS